MSNQVVSESHFNIIKHVMGDKVQVTHYTHPQDGLTLAFAYPEPLSDSFLKTIATIFNSGDPAIFLTLNEVLATDKKIVWAVAPLSEVGGMLAVKVMSTWTPETGRINIETEAVKRLGTSAVVTTVHSIRHGGVSQLVYIDRGTFTPEERMEINDLYRGDEEEVIVAISRLTENQLAVFETYDAVAVGVNAVAMLARVKTLEEMYSVDREVSGTITIEVKKVDDNDGAEPYYVYRNFKLDLGTTVIPHQYRWAIDQNALKTFKQNSNALITGFLGASGQIVKSNDANFTKLEIPCESRSLFTAFTITTPKKPALPDHATSLVQMS